MFHFFQVKRDEFLEHYHQRSNVESVFSAIKRKFGDSVRSKTTPATVNEVLCKILCNNIWCVIQAWYEMGIDPADFGMPKSEGAGESGATGAALTTEAPAILRFPGVCNKTS